MAIVNASNLRKNLFSYLDDVVLNDETVIVTGKSGNVVMVSEEYYRSLEDTIYLHSIPGMAESIAEGKNTPQSPYFKKALRLLEIISETPFAPPVEKLLDCDGVYSRRINIQHRLVYTVNEKSKTIIVIRMWTHYGDS